MDTSQSPPIIDPQPEVQPQPTAVEAAQKYAQTGTTNPAASHVTIQPAKQFAGGTPSDVDLDPDTFQTLVVRLGGRRFRAKEQTIGSQKALTEIGMREEARQRDGAEISGAQHAMESLSAIYPQVADALEDIETGEPPSREFVEKHLTTRNFGRLMRRLNEDAAEGNEAAG